MPQPDDTLTLVAGGQLLTGWESASITRGIEIMPSSFEIGLTEKYPGRAADIVVKPGEPCVVLIGNDPVVTGTIDRTLPAMAPRQHTVHIHGRSKCEDLVDCSAGVYPSGTTLRAGYVYPARWTLTPWLRAARCRPLNGAAKRPSAGSACYMGTANLRANVPPRRVNHGCGH